MNENESKIKDYNDNIEYYKTHIHNAANGIGRKAYKDAIKMMEYNKQLALLKERNIKG